MVGISCRSISIRPYNRPASSISGGASHDVSTVLRTSLYPSRGNSARPRARYLNLMITMLLGGVGMARPWTFVAWGALHGAISASSAIEHFVPNRPALWRLSRCKN